MTLPSELDKAQLKFELRQLYSHIGFMAALQVLLEMIVSAEILAEVIVEEHKRGS